MATPASYARFTAAAHNRAGNPPMLIDTTRHPTAAAYSIPLAIAEV
jgi:hypothetical protein